MVTCSLTHDPITHDEFHCPLCAALEDLTELENKHELELLNSEILQSRVDELGLVKLETVISERDALQGEANTLQREVDNLIRVIQSEYPKPLGKRIENMKRVAADPGRI